jgi:hypothetical protein
MKLIDVPTMQGRANSVMLLWESVPAEPRTPADLRALARVREECQALAHGLDLYAEANPQTIAPGITKRRTAKRRTTKRRRKAHSQPHR